MQLTNISFTSQISSKKKYVTFDEHFAVRVTVKLGANEELTTGGFRYLNLDLGIPGASNVLIDLGEQTTGGNMDPFLREGVTISAGGSLTLSVDDLYVPFSASALAELKSSLPDRGAARCYPMRISCDAYRYKTKESSEPIEAYHATASVGAYFLLSRLAPEIIELGCDDLGNGDPFGSIGQFVQGVSRPLLRQHRSKEVAGRRMNFSPDASANSEGLLGGKSKNLHAADGGKGIA